MAITNSWKNRVRYVINKNYVSTTLSNFPVLISTLNTPSIIYKLARSDGGDIRVTTDASGATEVPVDIVNFSVTTKTCEIWTKISSVSSTSNTEFFVWFNNPSATTPASNSTYGSQNVWTGYSIVLHSNNSTNDSTSNGTNFTGNSISYTTDLWGNTVGASTTSDSYQMYRNSFQYSTSISWSYIYKSAGQTFFFNTDDSFGMPRYCSPWNTPSSLTSWGTHANPSNVDTNGNIISQYGKWTHFTFSLKSGQVNTYVNGVKSTTNNSAFSKATAAHQCRLGGAMTLAEARLNNGSNLSDGWIVTDANQVVYGNNFCRGYDDNIWLGIQV